MSGPKGSGDRPSPRHYEFVDALRGFAILGVICHHIVPFAPDLNPRLATLARNGFEGVQLFFVMSAFTLFLSLDSRRGGDARPLADFFVRRFFRIAPLFYAGFVFYYAFDGWGENAKNGERPGLGCVLATLTFTNGWHGGWINRMVPGGWSVAVEMSFYLIVPLLHAVIRSPRAAFWGTFLALLLAAGANAALRVLQPGLDGLGWGDVARGLDYYWLPTHLPIFFMGVVLYFLLRPALAAPAAPSRRRTVDGLVALCFSVYLMAAVSFSDVNLYLGHVLFGVAFVLLGWSLCQFPNPVLVNPVTRYIGKISYSAYITHFAVLHLVTKFQDAAWSGPASGVPPGLRFFLLLLAVVTGTALASTATYHLIELPGIRVGRSLIRRMEARGAGRGPLATSRRPSPQHCP